MISKIILQERITERERKLKFSAFACKLLNTVPGYLEYSEQCVMVIDNDETVQ